MMTFVNMDAPGITILPTHRVVTGIENFSSPDFITKASAFYTITELDADAQAPGLIEALTKSPGDSVIAATGDATISSHRNPTLSPLFSSYRQDSANSAWPSSTPSCSTISSA